MLIYAIANGQADTDRIIRIFLEVATEFCKKSDPRLFGDADEA